MKNRGRFQAQGDGFEDSVSWSQETPLTAKDGLDKLNELIIFFSGYNNG